MKKLLLLLLAGILAFNMSAQSYFGSDASVVFKGGYNFNDKQSTTTLSFVGDFAFFRVGFNLNCVIACEDGLRTVYVPVFSPAIGLSYGERNMYYLMFGAQPRSIFGKIVHDSPPGDIFNFSLEAGCDIPLNDLLYINFSAQYWLPSQNSEIYNPYQGFNLMAGLGFYL